MPKGKSKMQTQIQQQPTPKIKEDVMKFQIWCEAEGESDKDPKALKRFTSSVWYITENGEMVEEEHLDYDSSNAYGSNYIYRGGGIIAPCEYFWG